MRPFARVSADVWARPPANALTNRHNERPTWLGLTHERLDAAVFAAYGWEAGTGDGEVLARLLALNDVSR